MADPVTVLGAQRMLTFTVSSIVQFQIHNKYHVECNLNFRAQADQTQELLGVERTATPDQIKKAYRKVRISSSTSPLVSPAHIDLV